MLDEWARNGQIKSGCVYGASFYRWEASKKILLTVAFSINKNGKSFHKSNNIAVRWWCSGDCNITISRGPGLDPQAWQEKEVPLNTLVCSCGSLVELSLAFRSLSGDNLAQASHPRMGQSHIFKPDGVFCVDESPEAERLIKLFSRCGSRRYEKYSSISISDLNKMHILR